MPLSIDLDDIYGIIEALKTAGWVTLLLIWIAIALIGFTWLDDWLKERRSPISRLLRKRHFGGF